MILKTKVRNAISKKVDAEFSLSNITINGQKRGCAGFVRNKDNGVVVYISTEPSCLDECGLLHRYAKDTHDYRGCRNRFSTTFDRFMDEVVEMLGKADEWEHECETWR